MPTNKEFTKLATQLSQLAKFYLANLNGTAEEVAKKEKSLTAHVRKSHRQLRVAGTSLILASSKAKTFDSACPNTSYQCPDGSCVPNSDCCGSESGLLAAPVAKAKPAAKKPVKKAAKKK